ncbi:MAG: OB-fold nucleic acid binding domain-containing protein [Phascolarctobacterium sp.]
MWWKDKVTILKGIGAKKAEELAAVGIFTVGDLLEYYPRQGAYLDYSRLKKIKELDMDGTKQVFRGEVYGVRNGYGSSRRAYTVVTVRDETGYANLYFFMGQRYTAKKLKNGMELIITGRVRPGRTQAKSVSEVTVQVLMKKIMHRASFPFTP